MDINLNLVLQEPIIFQGVTIYQPTLEEIMQYGVDEYNNLLIPYSLSWDLLGVSEEERHGIKYFDLIISNEYSYQVLIQSLIYFCRTDSIEFTEMGIRVGNGIITRDNFDEFGDIILKISAKEKPKEEKLPDNPKQREIELKLREARARCKPKNEFQLYDIINNVRYGGKYYIPLDEIKQMTLWSLSNAFNAKVGLSAYDANFSIALVVGDKNNTLEENHWTKILKIDK